MNTHTSQQDAELRYKAQAIIQAYHDTLNNGAGHHSVVSAGKDVVELFKNEVAKSTELAKIEAQEKVDENIKQTLFDQVDKHFPKGQCKERGAAMLLVAETLASLGCPAELQEVEGNE